MPSWHASCRPLRSTATALRRSRAWPTPWHAAAIQQAFVDEFAVQCGFCIPGFIVASASLLGEIHDPADDDIRLGLSGNLCRCTGYYPIMQAVRRAGVVPVELDESVFG